MYEIKYKKLPNNLVIVKIELKTKTIIYINTKKDRTLCQAFYQEYRK